MVQPIDYLSMLQRPNLGESLLSGIKTGAGIRQLQDQRAEAEQAAQRSQQYSGDLQNYLANPTAQGAAEMTAKYPEQRKAFEQSWNMFNKGQQDSLFSKGSQAYHALETGRADVAEQILSDQITALENSGQDASQFTNLRDQLKTNPQGARAGIGLALANLDPEKWDKIVTSRVTAEKAPFDVRKSGAEAFKAEAEAAASPERVFLENQQKRADIKNIESQVNDRSGRLNLDRDKLQSDVEAKLYELGQKKAQIGDSGQKIVNDATMSAVTADQSASNLLDLASRLEKEGGGYGAFSTANEWFKGATGRQDELSLMKKEYIRLRNTQALKMLPPGAASDKDIQAAMEGFPDASADARSLSSFLRGMAKMTQIEAAGEEAKAEWVNQVGGLGTPKSDIVVGGVNVPAGTTFVNFSRNYISQKAQQRGAEQTQQQIPNRSYMKYANPGAQ